MPRVQEIADLEDEIEAGGRPKISNEIELFFKLKEYVSDKKNNLVHNTRYFYQHEFEKLKVPLMPFYRVTCQRRKRGPHWLVISEK